MDISVCIMAFNEERNLPRLFAPLKGIKDIVLINHNSQDNTEKLAKELGARVITREYPIDVIIQKEDVQEFKKRFGMLPRFKAGDKIYNGAKERQYMTSLAKNDWILNVDCDEVVTWNLEKLKSELSNYDTMNCKFYHMRNPDGSRTTWLQTTKLYNRQKVWWEGRIHEIVNGYDIRVGWTDNMEIDHYSFLTNSKKDTINHLEYSALYDKNYLRAFYYLGIEHHVWGEYEQSIRFFTLYLKDASYLPEKVRAYLSMADSFWQLGKESEAWICCNEALRLNPKCQDAFVLLAQMSSHKDQKVWIEHAKLAENDHLL